MPLCTPDFENVNPSDYIASGRSGFIACNYNTSEAGNAAMVEIQKDALKAAGLPTDDLEQIIDRKFAFYYGYYGVIIGTITGINIFENHDVVLFVTIPSIQGTEIQFLKFTKFVSELDPNPSSKEWFVIGEDNGFFSGKFQLF